MDREISLSVMRYFWVRDIWVNVRRGKIMLEKGLANPLSILPIHFYSWLAFLFLVSQNITTCVLRLMHIAVLQEHTWFRTHNIINQTWNSWLSWQESHQTSKQAIIAIPPRIIDHCAHNVSKTYQHCFNCTSRVDQLKHYSIK
jgi:hypothetical protein